MNTAQIILRFHLFPTFFTVTSPHVRPRSYPQSCPLVHRPAVIPGSSLSTDDNLDQEFPVVGNSGPSKTHLFSHLDETLFCQDELLEKMFKEDPNNIPDSWATDEDEEDEDTASDASLPADIDGVQTRGYNQDFWAPLIGNPLGGSDAAEVMAGIAVPKTAPHIIHCTTGDAFDHTVLVSGELPPYCKPEVGSSSLPVHPRSCPPVHPRTGEPVHPRSGPPVTPQSFPPVRRSTASTSSARTSPVTRPNSTIENLRGLPPNTGQATYLFFITNCLASSACIITEE
ncbi:LOW QUALITY PROTEIN: hypothetical protein HID58_061115 [Brassica napus]|uniref:Uncharacterized protein n=1 Tax=Brassica napus TaxID=3708 RepID=A0ABQ7ZXN6_BRANA|nr:LOW QUALITY PROTEIN: hypothetical protein HID58_061115 [Brassica napus]